MKFLSRLFLAVLLLAHPEAGFAATNDATRAETLYKNLLAEKNPGFENGKSGWSVSGGTLSTAISGSNFMGIGRVTGTWDSSSAAQTLTSSSYTIGNGLAGTNGLARCKVMTASGTATHTMGLWDGTNLTQTITIPSSTSSKYVEIPFVFGAAASTVAIRFTSVASDEPLISIDDCYIGDNFQLSSQMSMTEWVSYTPTFTGFGASVSNVNFRSRRDGPDLLVQGTFTTGTPTAVKPQITLGYAGSNANVTSNAPSNTVLGPSAQGSSSSTFFGIYPLSDGAQTYFTFGSQESAKGGTTILTSTASFGSSTIVSVNIRVPILGWSSQSAVRVDNADFDWTSYTPTITNAGGGMTNATTTGMYRKVGDTLEARGQTVFSSASASFSGYFIGLPSGLTIDTTKLLTSTQDIARIGDGNILDSGVLTYPGFITLGSSSRPQLLFAKSVSGTNPVNTSLIDIGATVPFTFAASDTISWRLSVPIVGWTNNQRVPLLVGSVTSNTAGLERIERASIVNTAGAWSVGSQSGSWISSITDNGVGDATLNIAAGIFSGAPSCVCTARTGSSFRGCQLANTITSTSVNAQVLTDAGAFSDQGFDIHCMGPR